MPVISVVIPVYKAEGCLRELDRRLKSSLEAITEDYEIVLVEDCGGDHSWEVIRGLAQHDPRVRGLQLSRNFGQHRSITAGLDHCNGDWVVVMDCDLQDRPEEIARLYAKAKEGFEVVYAHRTVRRDGFLRRFSSRAYFRILGYLADQKSEPPLANFGIYSRNVIDNFRRMRESARSFPRVIRRLGFPSATVDVEHAPRFCGGSSYTLSKLFDLGIDGIVTQSNGPFRFSIKLGLFMTLSSLLAGGYCLLRWVMHSTPTAGWTTLTISAYFLAGLLLINVGLLGLYIGHTHDETKGRPLYVVREQINLAKESTEVR